MPTSYTHNIAKGISFEEFALSCARAFGALVSMRDDTENTPIPDEIKLSNYYKEKLAEIKSELTTIENLTPSEIKQRCTKEYQEHLNYQKERRKEMANLKKQYTTMLASVNKWAPPTVDHVELKGFMVDQITKSIDYDCDPSYYSEKVHKKDDRTWVSDKIKELKKDLAYYTKEYKKEIERCKERTKWIQALKQSLK